MKLTRAQLQELLTGLGIAQPVEIVETQEEADQSFSVTETINAFLEQRKPIFMAEFNESILPEKLKAVAGEFGGKLNGFIRKASNNLIPLSDLEGMKDEEKIQKLVEILNENKGKDTEELRTQLQATIEQHNKDLETIKAEYEQKVTAAHGQLHDYKISDYLATKIVPTLPLLDGDLGVRTNLLKSAISEKYNLVMNDKGVLELRDKENIEKPVIDPAKNTILEPVHFATEFFTGLGIVKKDNRHDETESDKNRGQQQQQHSHSFGSAGIDETTTNALDSLGA